MAKRLTDTEKWKKGFIKSLPLELKLVWIYILDECDFSGVWEVEWDVLQFRMGAEINQEKALQTFGDKVQVFDGGKKWFIRDFIEFQYGTLNPANRTHKAVIQKIEMYKNKGLASPLQGAKDTNTDKDKDKDMDKGGYGGNENREPEIKYPIEHCAEIATKDPRWMKANKTSLQELQTFNGYLEKISVYEKNPLDYKQHFAHFKHKYPDRLAPGKEMTVEELKQLAREMDKKNKAA